MKINTVDYDLVIKGYFATGVVTYQYAIDNLVKLIDKLDYQRKFQNEKFYSRLEKDLQKGCIMPSITLAFVDYVNEDKFPSSLEFEGLVAKNLENGFILDGIQRLNTIKRIVSSDNHNLDLKRNMYINIIICSKKDNLLYRMVTLNNGQKPMTARHQIEMLASNLYDFKQYGFDFTTEKDQAEKKIRGAFKKADIINAYISFLSNSTSLDNKKIIEDKLDELVARKVIDSQLIDVDFDFDSILYLVGDLSKSSKLKDWLKNGNNLIGFTVGLRTSFHTIRDKSIEEIENLIGVYEKAFKNINVSKIKLGRERKRLAKYYIENINELAELDSDELTLELADQI